jgi:hypothetical protein
VQRRHYRCTINGSIGHSFVSRQFIRAYFPWPHCALILIVTVTQYIVAFNSLVWLSLQSQPVQVNKAGWKPGASLMPGNMLFGVTSVPPKVTQTYPELTVKKPRRTLEAVRLSEKAN